MFLQPGLEPLSSFLDVGLATAAEDPVHGLGGYAAFFRYSYDALSVSHTHAICQWLPATSISSELACG